MIAKLWTPAVIALVILGLGFAWLVRRPKPAPSAGNDAWDQEFGLSLSGPARAQLPAPDDAPTSDYPAVVTARLVLPGSLWGARDRLRLLLRSEDGRQWENTFDALNQPLGILIERAYVPPSDVPHVTRARLVPDLDHVVVESEFRANLGLFDFPRGRYIVRAQAVLDDLRSNELTLELDVGAANDLVSPPKEH